jgi:hypothetical protein
MKKGCFVSVIIFLTVAVLAIFYIIKFHGEDMLEMGKDQLITFAREKIESDIADLQNGQYADSLKIAVDQYFNDLRKLDVSTSLQRVEEFADDIEVIMMDSKIDSAEFDFVINLLTKYERRKEN